MNEAENLVFIGWRCDENGGNDQTLSHLALDQGSRNSCQIVSNLLVVVCTR